MSLKYPQKTMIKLPLRPVKSFVDVPAVPKVVLIPSTRDNSIIPNDSEILNTNHLTVPLEINHSSTLYEDEETSRKFSVMSLLSIIASKKDRPSVFSRYRYVRNLMSQKLHLDTF